MSVVVGAIVVMEVSFEKVPCLRAEVLKDRWASVFNHPEQHLHRVEFMVWSSSVASSRTVQPKLQISTDVVYGFY